MRVVHLSWLKRDAPDNSLGGVEKFASYLRLVLGRSGHACQLVAWSDFPSRQKCERLANPDKALVLGSWAEAELEFDVAVSDGYWGLGITRHKVLPVVHGTWAQFHLNMGGSPWLNAEVQAQYQAFTAPNTFPVARPVRGDHGPAPRRRAGPGLRGLAAGPAGDPTGPRLGIDRPLGGEVRLRAAALADRLRVRRRAGGGRPGGGARSPQRASGRDSSRVKDKYSFY